MNLRCENALDVDNTVKHKVKSTTPEVEPKVVNLKDTIAHNDLEAELRKTIQRFLKALEN